MTDIEAIRIDHQRIVTSTGVEVCTGGGVWPCDAAILLAALDEARAERDAAEQAYREARQAWNEAERVIYENDPAPEEPGGRPHATPDRQLTRPPAMTTPTPPAQPDPRFSPVDMQEMMDEGVLMAANEAFFWPLGLALTWDVDTSRTQYRGMLHIREWVYPDGHKECIELSPDDEIGDERRRRFAAWLAARRLILDPQP